MKFYTKYFDMLDGRYRVAVQLRQCYVSAKSNRIARVKAKQQYLDFYGYSYKTKDAYDEV